MVASLAQVGTFEIVQTRAGHRAMLDHRSGEVMHPVVGPLSEAYDLYVEPARLQQRLAEPTDEPFVLLDVGLGAGSNACAALKVARAAGGRPLQVVSFDRTLDGLRLAINGGEAEAFGFDDELIALARQVTDSGFARTRWASWRAVEADLPTGLARELQGGGAARADAVFWDMFSARRNPELWSVHTFTQLRALCRAGATLHTYSGATATRSGLLLAGFCVGTGQPLSGGKSATEASVGLAPLSNPLGLRFLERLSRSSAPFPADAADGALSSLYAHIQFAGTQVTPP